MRILEKAKELRKAIKNHEIVFIVGHKDLDLDAIGSALGMAYIVEQFHKEAYIIIDDETFEPAVEKIIHQTPKSKLIKSENLSKKMKDKNLLIIVDTNKEKLLQNRDLLNIFEDIIIIDHHQPSSSSIEKGMILIDTESSSACELITELIYWNRFRYQQLCSEDTSKNLFCCLSFNFFWCRSKKSTILLKTRYQRLYNQTKSNY